MNSILDFLKKRSISTYIIALSAILSIIGFILFLVSNATPGYAMINSVMFIVFGVIAFVALGAAVYVSDRFGAKPWVIAIMLLALVLMCVCFGFILLNRVEVVASLSSFDKGNMIAASALNTAIASIVLYLISVIAVTVSSFMKMGKKA